jgi:hypothetical protein
MILVADLPIGDVASQERKVRPAFAGCFKGIPHSLGPVGIVAGGDDETVAHELARVSIGVDIGRVGDVVSLALEKSD